MATLFHFPKFSTPNKPFPSQKQPLQVPGRAVLRYPWRRASGIRASSSSSRTPRNGRKVRSGEELCSELKQFVSLIGLPEGHVPSMKLLSEHGRKDLANIVRRRGYRVINELLTTCSRVDYNGLHGEKSISENHGQDEINGNNAITISEVPLSMNVAVAKDSLSASLKSDDYTIKESSLWSQHGIADLNIDNHKFESMESKIISALEEKVVKFMQNDQSSEGDKEGGIVPPEAVEHASQSHSAIEGEQLKSYDGENYLSTKAMEESQITLDHLSSLMNQIELALSSMREQIKNSKSRKELALSRMREQIKNTKNALSALQTKTEAEIRRLKSEKDAELDALEESLSGL